ncbi:MAG: O-antigen translocase [Prevotella sp.]|uniref:O-antigen translocase n=1 Tax=Prevotella sp. TaxID=59823 RepID=UPI002A32BB7C|nr:O-antigen translocase [Prevotella sp.]MDD7317916.1 O-antigen translocase [Prevotellaceae bacterium]MDY4020807.1 O-antigen translocase [Prevotella sp.]
MAKSSGLVAFVQVFNMGFGLVRNKAIALMIGPSGFGIWSLMQTFITMLSSFSVFGLDQGGVREIAKNSDNKEAIGKCIFTFFFTILFFSVLFGIAVFFLSTPISNYLFSTPDYSLGIRFLSITVVLNGIAKGGYAVLNGIHALRYLAISQIVGAVIGSFGTIIIIYFGGVDYIALALSVVTIALAASTVFYVNKLKIKIFRPSNAEYKEQLHRLLALGFGFTVAGVISTIMTLLSRSYLSSHYSLDAVGIYQASWTISNLYTGVILSAMGIDFMPRLSKISEDNQLVNQYINRQIQFSMSFASLGITLILLLAPMIMILLYSSEFSIGVNIIRWQLLGVSMRVVAFPFSYAIMAKNKPLQYAIIQTLFWVSDYLLLMLFSFLWGFDALGINYFVAYIGYLAFTYMACRYNHGFGFSDDVRSTLLKSGVFIIAFFILCSLINSWIVYILCGVIWLFQLYLSDKQMKQTMDIHIMDIIKKMLHIKK